MRFLKFVFASLAILASFGGVRAQELSLQPLPVLKPGAVVDHTDAVTKAEHVSSAIRKESTLATTFTCYDITSLAVSTNTRGIYLSLKSDLDLNPIVAGGPFTFYGTVGPTVPTDSGDAGVVLLDSADTHISKGGFSIGFPTAISLGPTASVVGTWHYEPNGVPGPGDFDPLNPGQFFRIICVDLPTNDALSIEVVGAVFNGKPADTTGDPQFNGMQGQSYQFHGMADEVFSLLSYPDLQMNALFKFISSGTCNYNETVCWSHPGTYLGQIGIQYGADSKILLQSGSHADGMRVFVNDKEVSAGKHIHRFTAGNSSNAIMQYSSTSVVEINTDSMFIRIANSDYFFNIDFGLKNSQVLIAGTKPLHITGEVCEIESRTPRSQLQADTKAIIAKKLKETYPAYPLHGLIGQTWRNAVYCGRYFEGSVDDYVTGGLFSNEHTFNYFKA